jgi:hypothetical protein
MNMSDWLPMMPQVGPPLPRKLRIYWPWFKTGASPLPLVQPSPLIQPPPPITPWASNIYDLDGDGIVTDADMIIFKTYYGKPVNINDPINVRADYNGDGIVNIADFGTLSAHYGK